MTVIDRLTLALLAQQHPTVGIAYRWRSGNHATYYILSYCAGCASCVEPVNATFFPWPHAETPPGPAHRHCAQCHTPLTPTLEYLPCAPSR